MKLTITKKPFKGRPVGSEIEVTDRQARLLTKMGRGQYMTRHVESAPRQVMLTASAAAAITPSYDVDAPKARTVKVDGADVPIDEMEVDGLHELAKKLDVKVHHASGAEKVRIALVESQQAATE
jgi:hypothetical protein